MKSGPTTLFEMVHWSRGLLVAGIDEVGRGALAGPVVAAAVVLDPHQVPDGLNDSKKLSTKQRSALADQIHASACAVAIAAVEASDIDKRNILQATFDAMHQAVDVLSVRPSHLLVDGNRFRPHAVEATCIVQGDSRSVSIAAASIVAKAFRDAMMHGPMHDRYPVYGFNQHVGYATAFHRSMILLHGPSEIHRLSFLRRLLSV